MGNLQPAVCKFNVQQLIQGDAPTLMAVCFVGVLRPPTKQTVLNTSDCCYKLLSDLGTLRILELVNSGLPRKFLLVCVARGTRHTYQVISQRLLGGLLNTISSELL